MRSRIMVPRDHGATTAYMEIGPSYRGGNPEGVALWTKLEHERGRMACSPASPGAPAR